MSSNSSYYIYIMQWIKIFVNTLSYNPFLNKLYNESFLWQDYNQ